MKNTTSLTLRVDSRGTAGRRGSNAGLKLKEDEKLSLRVNP